MVFWTTSFLLAPYRLVPFASLRGQARALRHPDRIPTFLEDAEAMLPLGNQNQDRPRLAFCLRLAAMACAASLGLKCLKERASFGVMLPLMPSSLAAFAMSRRLWLPALHARLMR